MILARHILREHVAPFLYALVVITGIFLVDFVVQIMDSILSKGLEPRVVLELFVLNTAWMLALSVPMSVLVASLMAFGRLSADREIDAMRSAGVHPLRILAPTLVLSAVIAAGLVWFNNRVLPEANYRAASLREDISRKKPSVLLEPRTMVSEFDGFRIWIQDVDPGTDSLREVTIHRLERGGSPPTVIVARAGSMSLVDHGRLWRFRLLDGETHSPDREKPTNYLRVRFRSLQVDVPNIDSRLHRGEKGYRNDREMTLREMRERVRAARERGESIRSESAERIFADFGFLSGLFQVDSAARSDRGRPLDSGETVVAGLGRTTPGWDASQAPEHEVRELRRQSESRLRESDMALEQMRGEANEASRFEVEIHKKFSIPVACLAFVLVGAPLGVMARSGGVGTGVAYSLAFFVLYWAGLIRGEALADRGKLDPVLAMWLPDAVLALIGIFLATRMGREVRFLHAGWWKGLWRRRRPEDAS